MRGVGGVISPPGTTILGGTLNRNIRVLDRVTGYESPLVITVSRNFKYLMKVQERSLHIPSVRVKRLLV